MKNVTAVLLIAFITSLSAIGLIHVATKKSVFAEVKIVAPAAPAVTAEALLAEDNARAASFRTNLLKAIDEHPLIHPVMAAQVKRVLNKPESAKQGVLLRFMERHSRAHMVESHLVAGNVEALDWSQVDWALILSYILKLLIAILPLLLLL